MYGAKPKPEFYTSATFKHLADQFAQTLKRDTGLVWMLHGVQKSNRKTHEGQEAYFGAKFYPQDKTKPLAAELGASMITWQGEVRGYNVWVHIDRATKTVFEEAHAPKQFGEIGPWVANLKLPAGIVEELQKTASLAERVAARYARSV